jgi:hypothetical protein
MPVSLLAKGTINVCRFVGIDNTNTTTGGFHAVQCNATTHNKPFGISQEASNVVPFNSGSVFGALAAANYAQIAAADGEPVRIFGIGEECLLYAGEAISAGADLIPDAAGMGVAASTALTSQWVGARALQGAAAQYEKIRVMVLAYGTGSGS